MFNPVYYCHYRRRWVSLLMSSPISISSILSLSSISNLTKHHNTLSISSPPSSSISLSTSNHNTLNNNVTYQVLLVIGIILFVFGTLFMCMYCYIKPNKKRRFFRKIFKRRGVDNGIDNEPLLVLEEDEQSESKEGYFV